MRKENNGVYKLRMKYERAGVTATEELNKEVKGYLAENTPTQAELDIIAGIYDFIGENIERNEVNNRSAEEWRKLEKEYVVKSSFTLPDMVDNLLRRLEKGRITREQLEVERKQFRPCNHRFCLNYFIPQRKDAVYCSRDCKEREKRALQEFEKTSKLYENGTYLPPSSYKTLRQSENEYLYRKHERIFGPDTLNIISDTKDNGKRDRKNEERKNRKWQINSEVKGVEKPVNTEEMGKEPVNF